MKPRLKPNQDGSLFVVRHGRNPWGEVSARKFIQEHYGSLAAFASRYRFSYGAVCIALRAVSRPMKRAGQVATIRLVLGLPSQPSPRALISARSKRRAAK